MTEDETKTSEEWQNTDKHKDITILDPDGWRDGTCDFFKDKITESEYMKRRSISTCRWIRKEQ